MFSVARPVPAPGALVDLKLHLPNHEVLVLSAEICHVIEPGPRENPGVSRQVGVQFVGTSEAAMLRLDQVLASAR